MYKFTLYFLYPASVIALLALKFPPIENFLNDHLQDGRSWIIFAMLGITTLCIYYFMLFSPYKKLERYQTKKWQLLKKEADKMLQHYQQYELSINILAYKWGGFHSLEVKSSNSNATKFTVFGKVFEKVWDEGHQNFNDQLKLTCNQGVSGRAFKTGQTQFADFSVSHTHNDTLNPKQKAIVKDLKVLVSVPIKISESSTNKMKKKTIGVLNVESCNANCLGLVQSQTDKYVFIRSVEIFAEFYSHLY